MTFSEALVEDFHTACVQMTGRVLPLNHIVVDEEEGVGRLSYVVPDEDPPIKCVTGMMVREVTLAYALPMLEHLKKN